jgi:hypothetical protein
VLKMPAHVPLPGERRFGCLSAASWNPSPHLSFPAPTGKSRDSV